MTMSLNDAQRKLKDILAALEMGGKPLVILENDSPKAILLRYQDYESLVEHASPEPYITRRADISGGEPILRGTRISVRHIVERTQAGEGVDEIIAALPHLTAAQIYAALADYHDHRSEIDTLIGEGQLSHVVAARELKVERVTEGVAVVHKAVKSEDTGESLSWSDIRRSARGCAGWRIC